LQFRYLFENFEPKHTNHRKPGGETMVNKYAIIGLISSVLVFTSAYAQDWRNSPLKSKTSNEWRKKPYASGTSDSWRKSPLNSNDSQLRWNKNKWGKSRLNWRNSNTRWDKKNWQDSSTYWRNFRNKWDKENWRDNLLNWRNSPLEWKYNRKKYERGSTKQEIKEWKSPKIQKLPGDTEETKKEPNVEENLKPHMEIVVSDDNISKGSTTQTAKHSSAKEFSVVVYGSEGVKLIKKSEPITKKLDDRAIVIYGGSNSGN
jgi:hypothetical protein